MTRPYQLGSQSGDVFRNFILPVELNGTTYVRAIELRPGNKRLVHHANLVVDRGRMLRRKDGKDGQPGFPGMEVETEVSGEFEPDSHFLFWKPGSSPQKTPADMAWKLEPGSDLILNLHLQASGKPEIVDAVVGLYFAREAPKRFPMLLQLEDDGALDIAPGDAKFEVTDHLKLPVPVELLAIYPHAHYLGKRIEAWADMPGAGRRSLLLIDDWDINWQATYTFNKPVWLPAGTTIGMKITYDNTAGNPRNPSHPPKQVRAGNRSEDEMGHVWFQVLPSRQKEPDDLRLILQQAVMRRRIEKYPVDFAAHFNLGAALQALGKPQEALPYLTEAVRLRPANATARNNLAISLIASEKLQDAALQLREALAVDPEYQNARYNLARTLASQGKPAEALTELKPYLAAVPGDGPAQEFAGRLYASMDRIAESLPYFRIAAKLQPGDSAVQTNLGAALAMAGQLEQAIMAFESALRADPASQTAKDNLARAQASLRGKR